MSIDLSPDQKGLASLTLGDVIVQTRNNFPDERFRPKIYLDTPQYHLYGINPHPYSVWVTADGIGTKPELAERLSEEGDTSCFESLAFDTFAMIESDEARWGRFLLGVANVVDTNTADPNVIAALAKGAKKACDAGSFALLNGETAELGYRTSGYGRTRVNWNAVGVSLINPEKLILGDKLEPGQPILGIPETSIRSNGLSKARAILEAAYIDAQGGYAKKDYFRGYLTQHLIDEEVMLEGAELDSDNLITFMNNIMGHPFLEQMLIPWHDLEPQIARELLTPSTLYGNFIYDALGWVDGDKKVDITGMAHISGGGIPEKVKRMLEPRRLGAYIESPFPVPKAVGMLMDLAKTLPNEGTDLIDDRKACEQWNMGIGFVVVAKTQDEARKLIEIDRSRKKPLGVWPIGVTNQTGKIEFRGHTWNYRL